MKFDILRIFENMSKNFKFHLNLTIITGALHERIPRWHNGQGAALQIGRSLVRFQLVSLDFFIDINPSDRTMALGSTRSLTEMNTRSISWG